MESPHVQVWVVPHQTQAPCVRRKYKTGLTLCCVVWSCCSQLQSLQKNSWRTLTKWHRIEKCQDRTLKQTNKQKIIWLIHLLVRNDLDDYYSNGKGLAGCVMVKIHLHYWIHVAWLCVQKTDVGHSNAWCHDACGVACVHAPGLLY